MAICNWCGDLDTSNAYTSHICIEEKDDSDLPTTS